MMGKKKQNNNKNTILKYVILIFILILTVFVYSRVFRFDFTNLDDNENIVKNIDIQSLSFHNITTIFSTFYVNTYKPLTILTFSVVYHLFGLNPHAFHSVNIILHLLNVILIFIIIYRLTQNIFLTSFVTVFFAVHPMQTEAVCWISGLDNVLYAFFYLGAIILYLNYIQTLSPLKHDSNKLYFILAVFLFILSLLAKPIAVTLPFVLILIDYWFGRKYISKIKPSSKADSKHFSDLQNEKAVMMTKKFSGRYKINYKLIFEKIPFLILALAMGIVTIISEKYSGSQLNKNVIINYSVFNRIFIIIYSVSHYILRLILPVNLSGLYPPPPISHGYLPFKYYLSPVLIILIFGLLFLLKRHRKEIIFGILFFVFTISFALLAGTFRYYPMADRYAYIPYIGFFFIIGTIISSVIKLPRINIPVAVLMIIILVFSLISFQRTKVWADSISLFTDVIHKYPADELAYGYRGNARENLNDLTGAIKDYDEAVKINPDNEISYNHRGNAEFKLGYLQAALKDYNKSIEINPGYPEIFYNRGLIYTRFNKFNKAIDDLNNSIRLNPAFSSAYFIRAFDREKLNDFNGAFSDYEHTLRLSPGNYLVYYEMGVLNLKINNFLKAEDNFDEVIKLKPDFADAYYSRGLAEKLLNRLPAAIQDINKAISIDPDNQEYLNTRAEILNRIKSN